MRDLKGGDHVGGGYGYGDGGSWGWWGFAFIVFIIFAIIIAFAWLSNRNHGGEGWEKFLPLLGLAKGHFGSDDGYGRCHTEILKDQAKDTGQIIHNQDIRSYELKASLDNQSRFLEKNIDSVRNEALVEKIADLRAQLIEERTTRAVDNSHSDLRRELLGIKEHFKPVWFEPAYSVCGK